MKSLVKQNFWRHEFQRSPITLTKYRVRRLQLITWKNLYKRTAWVLWMVRRTPQEIGKLLNEYMLTSLKRKPIICSVGDEKLSAVQRIKRGVIYRTDFQHWARFNYVPPLLVSHTPHTVASYAICIGRVRRVTPTINNILFANHANDEKFDD